MADAAGVRGIRLEDPSEVEQGIADALAHHGPVSVDAVVNRTKLAMPPSITIEMAKSFSLYMVKAIISGRADDVIDLAKTNIWRRGSAAAAHVTAPQSCTAGAISNFGSVAIRSELNTADTFLTFTR